MNYNTFFFPLLVDSTILAWIYTTFPTLLDETAEVQLVSAAKQTH